MTALVRGGRIAVDFVLGTRPEAIKLAPLALAARARSERFDARIIHSGQHRALATDALSLFGLEPDEDLAVMEDRQEPTEVLARVLLRLPAVLNARQSDVVLVQGDTTTTLGAALCAHQLKIPVGHIEAGLRTDDRYTPFPEEMNRRIVTRLSSFHFAPTPRARQHLLEENIEDRAIVITGNSGVDALLAARALARAPVGADSLADGRFAFMTCHRRENHGAALRGICRAARSIVDARPDVRVVWPVHPAPEVSRVVHALLDDHPRVMLLPPIDYLASIWLLEHAALVLTDSGGLQEEAPTFGKPVFVLRDRTERPEGIEAGIARLVGTDPDEIVARVIELFDDPAAYRAMVAQVNPYGDGRASERILDLLAARLQPGRMDAQVQLARSSLC